jgi:putative sigma-54 modulation protein
MEVTVQSLHFTASAELHNFVIDKVNKLSHFYDRILSANVVLKLDKSKNADNKVCEIRLSIPGDDLFAKNQCGSFEEATTTTVAALENQITKMKAKLEKRVNPDQF